MANCAARITLTVCSVKAANHEWRGRDDGLQARLIYGLPSGSLDSSHTRHLFVYSVRQSDVLQRLTHRIQILSISYSQHNNNNNNNNPICKAPECQKTSVALQRARWELVRDVQLPRLITQSLGHNSCVPCWGVCGYCVRQSSVYRHTGSSICPAWLQRLWRPLRT